MCIYIYIIYTYWGKCHEFMSCKVPKCPIIPRKLAVKSENPRKFWNSETFFFQFPQRFWGFKSSGAIRRPFRWIHAWLRAAQATNQRLMPWGGGFFRQSILITTYQPTCLPTNLPVPIYQPTNQPTKEPGAMQIMYESYVRKLFCLPNFFFLLYCNSPP